MLLQFEKCLKRINIFLKLIGLTLDSADSNRTMVQRLRRHWRCSVHMLSLDIAVFGETIWLIIGLVLGASLWEITYLLPCLTLCLLGNFKVYYFIRHLQHVNEAAMILRNLQSNGKHNEEIEREMNNWLTFLSSVTKLLLTLTTLGVLAFALGPFLITGSYYLSTGEIKLVLPFLIWYPFDEFDIRIWPVVYLHQLWAAWVCVFSVYGPDCFFFTCCTFIHIQFRILQDNLKEIVKVDARNRPDVTTKTFKAELVQLVNDHRELIRCVNLLEITYSRSTLFNVVTSSLIICATGFNLMVIENLAVMAPFTSFLTFGLLQVFFYCYYGDYVMRSSIGVGDAVYNSRWYETGAPERKYLLIVLLRSQKPCRLSAYGFTDINLTAFTRILSTSWSYFALLRQMYHK
ncbi:odorant receptor 4 [Helicoverpa armigera]|uniref:odorant receptor 4 n=1 Tax=Helicoverpa armigera TaxID=29058 RepID=UPI0030838899